MRFIECFDEGKEKKKKNIVSFSSRMGREEEKKRHRKSCDIHVPQDFPVM